VLALRIVVPILGDLSGHDLAVARNPVTRLCGHDVAAAPAGDGVTPAVDGLYEVAVPGAVDPGRARRRRRRERDEGDDDDATP